MYAIFTYIWVFFGANVGKYSIHGAYGYMIHPVQKKCLILCIRLPIVWHLRVLCFSHMPFPRFGVPPQAGCFVPKHVDPSFPWGDEPA